MDNSAKTIRQKLLELTDGVVGTTTDIALLLLFSTITVTGAGGKSSYRIHQAFDEAYRWHDQINYEQIKLALGQLIRHGRVQRKRYSKTDISITNLGLERIREILPTYHMSRPWDGHVYLISYDIPIHANNARNVLRTYIKKTGGALLQDSLWINPYNPTKLIDTFMNEKHISGTVLISKLGKDGTIGDESLHALINRIYKLDELAKYYNEFILHYQHKPKASSLEIMISFSKILKEDPQLPFPLLPRNFPSEKAYKIYTSLMKSYSKR